MEPIVSVDLVEVRAGGGEARLTRSLAAECPIALEFNGLGYAVLMATPADLVDLAYGFALAERLIDAAADIEEVLEHQTDNGVVLRIFIAARLTERVAERVRHRVVEGSCGLCGIENLEQAMRPLPALPRRPLPRQGAIFAAADALYEHQPLNRASGAMHAAACCDSDGAIRLAREDVGRHNAFDKLIGAMLRAQTDWGQGFALLSSRCSYELVEKAVLAACPLLATISAPSSLAVSRAREAGLPLAVLVRPDSYLAMFLPGDET